MLEYKLPWQEVVSDLHDQVCGSFSFFLVVPECFLGRSPPP